MKSVLVVFVVVCIVGVFSNKDIDDCVAESHVDTKLFDDMMHNPNFKATREMDCFVACMFRKDGLMDAAGNVDLSKIKGSDDVKSCGTRLGKDACETAGKMMGCFIEKNATDMFHVPH